MHTNTNAAAVIDPVDAEFAILGAGALRKTPIVVNDGRSSYTTRVFATFAHEGMRLLAVEEIRARILSVQALETVRCFEEGVITEAADADLGSILGWGFSTWAGGTLSFIDTVGLDRFVQTCDRLAALYGNRCEVPAGFRTALNWLAW
jgi:3-hydroxyacyl-CoA dehydrogenase